MPPPSSRLTDLLRELEPQLIITHAALDPFNPDHGVAHDATVQARQLASGAGVASAFKTIAPPELLIFEPHQPELCGFVPTTFLDITPVWSKKLAAMEAMGAQGYLKQYYSERAEHRANHARRISGRKDIRRPRRSCARSPSCRTRCDRLRHARAARRRDGARGRRRVGIIDLPLTQIVPGSRVAGPARIALCAPRDNTMAHAAIAHASPATSSSSPAPTRAFALIGDLMATQAQRRASPASWSTAPCATSTRSRHGHAGLDALRARPGRDQGRGEELDVPVVVGGTEIRPGDLVVMDCDGAMALPASASTRCCRSRSQREQHENTMRARYAAGELSYDIQGLRKLVEG